MLAQVFSVTALLGFAFLIINVLSSAFGSMLGVDLPLDGYTSLEGFIPLSFAGLSFGAVVFGLVGRYVSSLFFENSIIPSAIALIVSILLGVSSYYLVVRFIVKPLRKNNPRAINNNDLMGSTATVTAPLRGQHLGTISLLDTTGAKISYQARLLPRSGVGGVESADVGEEVIVVDVVEPTDICVVTPLNIYLKIQKEN